MMVLYILLLLLTSTSFFDVLSTLELDDTLIKYVAQFIELASVSGVVSLVVFIGDSLLPSNLKEKLVGIFIFRKPGETIFTKIRDNKIKDNRFSNITAKNYYKNIIDNIPEKDSYEYENSNWYRIFKKNKDDGAVKQTLKDSLICRDLYIETVLFIFTYFISLSSSHINFSWYFLLILLVLAVATNIAARNKRKRFVLTVISVDISSYDDMKKED